MKKLSTVFALLSVICLLFCFAVNVSAAKVYTDGIFSYTVDSSDNATITAIDPSVTGEVVVPSMIGGYPVVSISETFRGNNTVTSVRIPESVQSLSYYAFYNCAKLEYVYIPSTVKYINERTFDYSQSLVAIYVDENNPALLSDENGILYNKGKTELIRFPANCSLEKYEIPDTVTKLRAFSFSYSQNLIELTLPENLENISKYAFYDSKALATVVFNNNLTTIYENAFASCYKLDGLELPVSLTEIKAHAFENCPSLSQVVIPEGVQIIGNNAFRNCDKLTSVIISSTVESIGYRAFETCGVLESIFVPEESPYFFSDENGILFNKNKTELIASPPRNGITEYVVPESVTDITGYAFSENKSLTRINFPKGLKSIGEQAFWDCEQLEGEIFIPENVENIGTDAFYACYDISAFNVDLKNQHFSSDEYGALYDKNKTILIVYPADSKLKEYIVPENVTLIKKCAIQRAVYLDKIIISDNVKTLEASAIYGCSLIEVIIGKGLAEINGAPFNYCTVKNIIVSEENEYFCTFGGVLYDKEKTILYKYPSFGQQSDFVVPDTVKRICNGAFYVSGLENIIFPNNVTTIGYNVFDNCYDLKTITVVNPNASISSFRKNVVYYGYSDSTLERYCNSGGYSFVPLYDGLSVDYEDGVLILSGVSELPVIDDEKMCPWTAFSDETECVLIRDIAHISGNAFSEFTEITSVIIESENIQIDDNVFSDCNKLKTVICFSEAQFAENSFNSHMENAILFAEKGKLVSAAFDTVYFEYSDGVVIFDKPVTIEHYDFFNLIAALCDKYPEVNELEFTQFTLLNGNMAKVDIFGREVNRTEISSFENDRLAVLILDEKTEEVVTVSFNELCEGVANGEIDKFLLVVINEDDEIKNEVVVDSEEEKEDESVITLVLRAIITFFNKILRLFKK